MAQRKKTEYKPNVFVEKLNNYVKPNPNYIINQYSKYTLNDIDNSYFKYVQNRYIGSPTNSAIINSYANYMLGEGLTAIGIEDIDKVFKKQDQSEVCKDLKMQGAFALQIIYSKDRKTIANINRIDVATIGFAYMEEDDLNELPSAFWYSYDWCNRSKFPPVLIPAFGTSKESIEILYYRIPSPQPIFSLPDYQSGLEYAQLEEELSHFFISHVKNRFSAGSVVNINQGGIGTPEAKEEAAKAIIAKVTGTSNAGNVIVSFNDNPTDKTTVDNITMGASDIYNEYQFLCEFAKTQILQAHGVVNPILFGVKDGSGFSNNADEMQVALKTLYRSQINPLRFMITDALEEMYMKLGYEVEIRFEDFEELRVDKSGTPIESTDNNIDNTLITE